MVRLYRGQVPKLASEIIKTLMDADELEVETASIPEAERDVASVIDEYLKNDMFVLNKAKDVLADRRESREALGRIRRDIALANNHLLGDEGMRWVQHQIIECLLASPNIEEVFADDAVLLKRIREVFDRVLVSEETLDAEVRGRLKNVQEGTPTWDIKYNEVMTEIRRKHGLISAREDWGGKSGGARHR